MEVSVFLGAEGCQEAEGKPWLREATCEEAEEMRASMGDKRWSQMIVDGTGRPHFLMFVSEKAPEKVLERVNMLAKLVRLTE